VPVTVIGQQALAPCIVSTDVCGPKHSV
jgi:hypothetical protein